MALQSDTRAGGGGEEMTAIHWGRAGDRSTRAGAHEPEQVGPTLRCAPARRTPLSRGAPWTAPQCISRKPTLFPWLWQCRTAQRPGS